MWYTLGPLVVKELTKYTLCVVYFNDRSINRKAFAMDNYDTLSNTELRDQLKAAGLNFPVTDTTRNALIKKLRNAVNGPAKPVKGRRETLSAVKQTSADDLGSNDELSKTNKPKSVNNRRATIAAAGIAPKPANVTNGVSNEKAATVKPVVAGMCLHFFFISLTSINAFLLMTRSLN